MEPEFVNESMWDDDDDGANNEETNFGEDDSNMEMTGFDGSTTGDGNITGGGEGGAVGDAQVMLKRTSRGTLVIEAGGFRFYKLVCAGCKTRWQCSTRIQTKCKAYVVTIDGLPVKTHLVHNHPPPYL